MQTLYRRELPSTCTALSSAEGQQLFRSSLEHNYTKSFFDLISQFHTQTEPSFCGPSTLVMVLNAFSIDPRKQWKEYAPWRWYTEEMLNCCVDLETIKKTGITFSSFVYLAQCQGLKTEAFYASESSVEDFRNAVKAVCGASQEEDEFGVDTDTFRCRKSNHIQTQTFLVVSYNRKVLQQTGSGHFSPIAAYDPQSDAVLVLDTARFKYTPHWVPLQLMFESMLPFDSETNKSRGYILLSFERDEIHCPQHFFPSQSILFRSKKSQNSARLKFKQFLNRKPEGGYSFHQILDYWTDEGKNYSKPWSILEPAPIPLDDKGKTDVKSILASIKYVMNDIDIIATGKRHEQLMKSFTPCSMRTLNITAIEAIFLIYLSTLDEKRRSQIIVKAEFKPSNDSKSDDHAAEGMSEYLKAQFLSEVDLIKNAIEWSNGENCSHCVKSTR